MEEMILGIKYISYVAYVGWGIMIRRFTWELVFPTFLPEALIYRHYMAFCSEDVLTLRLVQRVIFIKEL